MDYIELIKFVDMSSDYIRDRDVNLQSTYNQYKVTAVKQLEKNNLFGKCFFVSRTTDASISGACCVTLAIGHEYACCLWWRVSRSSRCRTSWMSR